jgi:diadenosine tetraphosphatase ApaH/serine/threonine PP2A family protein phosphatase
MSSALVYTQGQLSPEQRAFLGGLPVTRRIGDDILMCHGTPTDDYEYLLEVGHEGSLLLARPDVVARRLEGFDFSLVVCGHSHNPGVSLAPAGQLIVNPGSVGCPVFADNPKAPLNNCRAPHARYAIVDRDKAGNWSAELIALAYDWEKSAQKAESLGFPAWARAYRTGNV